MNSNYQNKVLLTGIMLLSLFVITLNNQSFSNYQFGVFVFVIFVLYCLPMVFNVEGYTNYKGSFSGYKLDSNCPDHWRKTPCNKKLNDTMGFTPQGSTVPPRGTDSELSNEHSTYPTVDGKSTDKKSMFLFAYNQASPDCCPSTYSTSRGCVCTNLEQRNYVNSRGGNNSTNSNF